jgi:hypothetical protein
MVIESSKIVVCPQAAKEEKAQLFFSNVLKKWLVHHTSLRSK